MSRSIKLSRRSLLRDTAHWLAGAGIYTGLLPGNFITEGPADSWDLACDAEILGQGVLRYRAKRHWGDLDRAHYPVKDCHGMTEDRNGRIVLLTNDTHNNLISYDKAGKFIAAWETRFPTAHGLEIEDHHGEDRYWITDHDVQCHSVCTADGHELRHIGLKVVAAKYPDIMQVSPYKHGFHS